MKLECWNAVQSSASFKFLGITQSEKYVTTSQYAYMPQITIPRYPYKSLNVIVLTDMNNTQKDALHCGTEEITRVVIGIPLFPVL